MTDTLYDDSGAAIPGFFVGARPEGLVVLHDVFGLTSQMRGTARRLAAEGFSTFAPDFFEGRVTDDETKGGLWAHRLNWKAAIERVRASVAALAHAGQGARVGVVGFGLGGAVAVAAAAHVPQIAACVTFYGIPTTERADLLRITCAVQGHFGNQDKQFTRDRVDAVESRLRDNGVRVEFFRYHVGHFFFNETRKIEHSPHNSQHAHVRMVAFLKREMGGGW